LRGISGVRGDTLIINLSGNPKGAIESISVVSGIIPHCINTIQGKGGH
jgi:molybdopterin biosynthesis enzyme MoaB